MTSGGASSKRGKKRRKRERPFSAEPRAEDENTHRIQRAGRAQCDAFDAVDELDEPRRRRLSQLQTDEDADLSRVS